MWWAGCSTTDNEKMTLSALAIIRIFGRFPEKAQTSSGDGAFANCIDGQIRLVVRHLP